MTPGFILMQAGGSGIMSFVMLALIIIVFYFFMIRPQMKRQKELRKFQAGLQKGDKVLVSGGILGKIVDVKSDRALVEVANEVKIMVLKSNIFRDSPEADA